ncbi:MAG: tetrahydrofolate dehydrogenase/cyclohydrolase catalytic domain-containing protein [Bacillota bacterium]
MRSLHSSAATSHMIVDGKAIAKDLLAQVREEVDALGRTPVVRAIVVAPSAATESYLRIKERAAGDAGMHLELVRLDDGTTEEVMHAVALPGADAVIVQLPLSAAIDTTSVLDAIPVEFDADMLSTAARTGFERGDVGALLPPVVGAIAEILARTNTDPEGKRVVIIGQGWLVGEPASVWFRQIGAEVTTMTRHNLDLGLLKEADIVVLGAGSPGLVKPEHLKEGVVLIDAGTSESDGAIVGDADPACAEKASVFTPVPGGVGPMAVACLFKNVALLVGQGSRR